MRYGPRFPHVHVNRVAAEIMKAGKQADFLPAEDIEADYETQQVANLMEAFIRKERLALTDAQFRTKYLSFIKHYYH